jgi:hypothetical protein
LTGVAGSSGSSGAGAAGGTGTSGSSGASGTNGSSGSSGSSGLTGVNGSSGSAGSSGTSLVNGITGTGTATYIPLFNGTNTLTSSIVSQQTINVNSTALTINGQSQSVYFEVGALLQYSLPNSGEIVKFGATSSTVIGKLYYLSQNSWNLATNTTSSASSGLIGMALGTSSTTGMLVRGNSNLVTSAFPIGDIIYLSTNGDITNVGPTASGNVIRIIGYSRGPSYLYFCPDNTWVQLV